MDNESLAFFFIIQFLRHDWFDSQSKWCQQRSQSNRKFERFPLGKRHLDRTSFPIFFPFSADKNGWFLRSAISCSKNNFFIDFFLVSKDFFSEPLGLATYSWKNVFLSWSAIHMKLCCKTVFCFLCSFEKSSLEKMDSNFFTLSEQGIGTFFYSGKTIREWKKGSNCHILYSLSERTLRFLYFSRSIEKCLAFFVLQNNLLTIKSFWFLFSSLCQGDIERNASKNNWNFLME